MCAAVPSQVNFYVSLIRYLIRILRAEHTSHGTALLS